MVSNSRVDISRREISVVSNFGSTDKQSTQKCKFLDDNVLYYWFCPFLLKTWIVCSDSSELLQSMIFSRMYTLGNHLFYCMGLVARKPVFRGFDQVRQNWPAQSQKPRILAYSSLSNYTIQVANSKSVDQTARMRKLICIFVVRTYNLQVFSRRG